MRIWIANHGEYADRRAIGVYSDKSGAIARVRYAQSQERWPEGGDIEAWDLDTNVCLLVEDVKRV